MSEQRRWIPSKGHLSAVEKRHREAMRQVADEWMQHMAKMPPKQSDLLSTPQYVVTVCCLENGNLPWIWGPFPSKDRANEWIAKHHQRIAGLHWVDMDSLGVMELSRDW